MNLAKHATDEAPNSPSWAGDGNPLEVTSLKLAYAVLRKDLNSYLYNQMKTTNYDDNCFAYLPNLPGGFERPKSILGANTWAISITAAVGDGRLTPTAFPSTGAIDAEITAAEMEALLEGLGITFELGTPELPDHGIALIQLDGPWRIRGGHTSPSPYLHWIALRSGYTFDANIGDWVDTHEWLKVGARRWMSRVAGCVGYQIKASFTFRASA